jgi:hypothetical protein
MTVSLIGPAPVQHHQSPQDLRLQDFGVVEQFPEVVFKDDVW